MDLIDTPVTDVLWRAPIVARSDGCRWIAAPMLFTVRLVGVTDDCPDIASYGWCYHTMGALVAAVAVFDPDTQDEPVGWHKRAGLPRRASHRDLDPEYNRPRCVHGTYLATPACGVAEVCNEFPFPRST